MNTPKHDAYRVYLVIQGSVSFAFRLAFTVNLVYQVVTVGLNPLQLVLLGTMLEGTILLFEIPTGVVADIYSRRLSFIVGIFLLGIGMFLEGSFPTFGFLLFSSFIAGIGYTFISGAEDAWLVDEIGQQRANYAILRGAQIGQIMSIVGIIVSVVIASFQLNRAIIGSGVILILLGIYLLLFMPEDNFKRKPKEERETWNDFVGTFKNGFHWLRFSPILLTIFAVEFFYGAFTESYDRLWTAHLIEDITLPTLGGLDPIYWFGVISIVSTALTIIATEIVRRKLDMQNFQRIATVLAVFYGLLIMGTIGFAFANTFVVALLCLWLINIMRGVSGPVFRAWMNNFIASEVRATVLSLFGQTNAIGQLAGGPALGYVGLLTSIRTALTLGALLLIPSIPLYLRTTRYHDVPKVGEVPST